MKYLVANWKMNLINSKNWIYDFNNNLNDSNLNDDLRIVICPNYLQLPKFNQNNLYIKKYNLTPDRTTNRELTVILCLNEVRKILMNS